jgi:phosphoglycerate dehydrogenase-like enzyme
MTPGKSTFKVLIASYLEREHVRRIQGVDERLNIVYEPELLRPPRYPADHQGQAVERSADQEGQWRRLLEQADILFDFDQTHLDDLPELARNVRWIQATSAGIGQLVKRMGYDTRMPNTVFTTASGVHAKPLTEFCLMAMLMFNKGLLRMVRDQSRKHWERYAGTDLVGRTLVVVGVGAIGREVVRLGKALGMTVIGVDRNVKGLDATSLHLDQLHPPEDLHDVLKRAEYLVLIVPHTGETEKMIGATELGLLPKDAVLINIGRGALVDEPALIDALRSGHIGGAALDVFAEEPLPQSSPLWEMPNVLVSPHSGSTSDRENARLTDLFCENLRRYLAEEPLLNVLDTERLY